jgi:hypothetical protein
MVFMRFKFQKAPWSIVLPLVLLGIAILLRGLFAWTSLAHLPATSDEASSVLLAKMIFRGLRPLLFVGQPYQFPVEAYLMAPFVEWLPRNAFGARYQTLLFGFLSLLGLLLIVRTAFPKGLRWPAGLLVLFPSGYLLMLTSAYAPPQYAMFLTLAWLSTYLALQARQRASTLLVLLSGLTSGLALSNHPLSVTIIAGIFIFILFGGNSWRGLQSALLFAAGFLVGALPYILAMWHHPGAYSNIPDTLSITKTFFRLLAAVFTRCFAGGMGVNPVLFPDFDFYLGWPDGLRSVFVLCYIPLLIFVVGSRLRVFYRAVANRCWPTMLLVDIALIASVLMFLLFAYHLAGYGSYRYLLPAVWSFPFLVGHAYLQCRGRWQGVIGWAVIVLALFNFATSAAMIKQWRKPGRIMHHSDTPPIDALLQELKSRNITHCYASFWLAYRITYESDENIKCAMPYNERFLYWPLPYKEEVDDAPEAVYVLTESSQARLSASIFENDLMTQGIEFQVFEVGNKISSFLIYHHFNYPPSQKERTLDQSEYRLRIDGTEDALTTDTEILENNQVSKEQDLGESWRVDLALPQTIAGITFSQFPQKPSHHLQIRIDVLENKNGSNIWRILTEEDDLKFEKLAFGNNRPAYNVWSHSIRFKPTKMSAFKIAMKDPKRRGQPSTPTIRISAEIPQVSN